MCSITPTALQLAQCPSSRQVISSVNTIFHLVEREGKGRRKMLQQTKHLHNTVALTISNQITCEREDRGDRPKKTGTVYNDISCLLHCFSITANLEYLDSYI